MEETVPVESVLLVFVAPIRAFRILPTGAVNTHGIKNVVNALYPMKVEEMLMLSTTIQTDQQMSDCGKLITLTGDNAVMGKLHAILKSTWHVQLEYTHGEETHSNCGRLIQLADAEHYGKKAKKNDIAYLYM